jgi:hypothetical protein
MRENIVEILYTHVCKWKMRPVEAILGVGEGWIGGEWWGGEFNYDIV